MREKKMERNVCEMACIIHNNLRLEKKFCDGLIEVDGVEFHVHKIILCGCSLFFRNLFTNNWYSPDNNKYNIPGVSSQIMEMIIEYVYIHHFTVTQENVCELLIAADYLLVDNLVNECCTFLKDKLCLKNGIRTWGFANFYSCKTLKQQAFQFILYNFEEMVHISEEFLELTVEQLSEIIVNDELNVKKEQAVFEAILKWIEHAMQERTSHIQTLLHKVRLELLPQDFFRNQLKNNESDTAAYKQSITRVVMNTCSLNLIGSHSSYPRRPRLPSGVLLAIGGWNLRNLANIIEVYDPRAKRWFNAPYEDEIPRVFNGTVYLNGFVYCIGGSIDRKCLSSVRKFNPITKTWTQVGPMHYCRTCVSACVLNGFIYAMGGCDGHNYHNTAERYEPENNQWSMIAPMHERRSHAGATSLNGKVYICGGADRNEFLLTAEFYNPDTNQWTLIPRMSSRRSGVGVITYSEQVYAVGGYDGVNFLRTAEMYVPESDSWIHIPGMINQRGYFGIGVLDGLLFVVGGETGFFNTSKAEYYDVEPNMWHEIEDIECSRSALTCCVLSGLPNMAEYAAPQEILFKPTEQETVPHSP